MGRALSLIRSLMLLASAAAFVYHWEGGEAPMTALHVGKSFCALSEFFSLVSLPEGKIWRCVMSCVSVVRGCFQRDVLYILMQRHLGSSSWYKIMSTKGQQVYSQSLVYARRCINLTCFISICICWTCVWTSLREKGGVSAPKHLILRCTFNLPWALLEPYWLGEMRAHSLHVRTVRRGRWARYRTYKEVRQDLLEK